MSAKELKAAGEKIKRDTDFSRQKRERIKAAAEKIKRDTSWTKKKMQVAK